MEFDQHTGLCNDGDVVSLVCISSALDTPSMGN